MKVRKVQSKNFGTTRQKPNAPMPPKECKAAMTDAQREIHVKQALTRFVRNKNLPQDLESLRYNLIVARVMQGMLATEAAELFGYANSTQLSLIESGQRETPKDHKFLRQAAQVYSVSVDWLLSLSPHMEPDAKVAHQYALLRGTETMIGGIVSQITSAMIATANETAPVVEELERIITAIDDVAARFAKVTESDAFMDLPGGAPVLAAVQRLTAGVAPLRHKLKKLKGIDAYMEEVRNGSMPSIPYLTERYSQRELGLEL